MHERHEVTMGKFAVHEGAEIRPALLDPDHSQVRGYTPSSQEQGVATPVLSPLQDEITRLSKPVA